MCENSPRYTTRTMRAYVLSLLLTAASLLSLAGPPGVHAQGETASTKKLDPLASLRFRHLTVDNGLPHNRIEAVLQDRHGFMWFGTADGLARYDGYRVVIYKHRPHDANSLSNNLVTALLEDQQGMVWVGTREGGLNRSHPGTQTFTRYQHNPDDHTSLRGNNVSALGQDQAGNLWVGTAHGDLQHFTPATETFTDYPLAPCGPKSAIRKIVASPSGGLWVVAGGLQKLAPHAQQATCYLPDADVTAGPAPLLLNDMVEAPSGHVWLAARNALYKFDLQMEQLTAYSPPEGQETARPWEPGILALSKMPLYATALTQDAAGLLWIGTVVDGIFVFDPQAETFIAHYTHDPTNPHSPSKAPATQMYRSREGMLWIGMGFGGVDALDLWHTQFTFYRRNPTSPNSFLARPLRAVTQDSAGIVWVGAAHYLTRFDPVQGVFQHANPYPRPRPPAAPQAVDIATIYPDDQGGIWFDGVDGLYRFDTHTETFRVHGSHADGVWSGHEASVHITVTPPWWRTWWFRSVALGALVGGVLTGFRWRVRHIEERNRWLETQVSERTAQLAHSNQALAAAKERAEATSQAKSAFLSNMSHELRTPLNSILGYAQILGRSPDLAPSQRDGVNTIYSSGKHLLTLISDVLDLAKIEASRLELHPAAVDLPTFLEGIVGMMQTAAQQKSLRLVYRADPHVPPSILADEKRLRQVLLNLLGNAVKFTAYGQVTFRVTALSRVAMPDAPQPDTVRLRFDIQDTGVGIAPEQLANIFQPFEQAGHAAQRAAGTGLGLAISQQLVALMGGRIQVQSAPGQGSTFWFEAVFPLAGTTTADHSDVPHTISGYQGQRRRILVVDDRPENRLVLLDVLQPLGFEVIMATNGQEGIDQARQMLPDVIFMDLVMPDMMGFEAVTAIRHMPALAQVPIIAVSASVHEIERAESQRVGCNGFLPKPIDVEQLLEMLQQSLHLVWLCDATPAQPAAPAPATGLLPPPREELETVYELCRLADEFDDEQIQKLMQHYLLSSECARDLMST